jgi:hypothetical protein
MVCERVVCECDAKHRPPKQLDELAQPHPCLSVTAGLIFASLQPGKKGPPKLFPTPGNAWIQDPDLAPSVLNS